jgi:hypothetical protein
MFLEPSRGPLQIATLISEGCFQKIFDRKSEPCELKKSKRIMTVVYKNCALHAKISDTKIIPVRSQDDLNQLLQQISETMDQEHEPDAQKPQSSNREVIRNQLKNFHYKEN